VGSILRENREELADAVATADVTHAQKVEQEAQAKKTLEDATEKKTAALQALSDAKNQISTFIASVKAAEKEVAAKGKVVTTDQEVLAEKKAGLAKAQYVLSTFKALAARERAHGEANVSVLHLQVVDGLSLNTKIIETCKGVGDGRVSEQDASNIIQNSDMSRAERWTLRYCLLNFKWEEAGQKSVAEACRKATEAADQEPPAKKQKTGKSYYETVDGVKCDRDIIDACRLAVEGQGDGRVSLEDAKKVFEEMADGHKITEYERFSLSYCLTEFIWTTAAHDWIIEKVNNF